MVEVIGDVVDPSVLIIPISTAGVQSGSLMKSGSSVVYISGSNVWQIEMTKL